MTMAPRVLTYLLPLTPRATLNPRILTAAVAAASGSPQRASDPDRQPPRVAFRIAHGPSSLGPTERERLTHIHATCPEVLPEASAFVVDFTKPPELARALDGCDGLVLSTGLDAPDLVDAETALLAAATEVGVPHVLKVSCPQGLLGERSSVAFGRQHWHLEQRLRGRDVPGGGSTRLVHPNTMMDALLHGRWRDMVLGRSLSVSVRHGRVAWVDPDDVAEVIRVLLSQPANALDVVESYALTGPEALTFADVAARLSEVLAPPVTYSYLPLWAVQPSMWIRGERPEAIAAELELARAREHGCEAGLNSTIEDVLGRPPRSLGDFVRAHADAWPHQGYK